MNFSQINTPSDFFKLAERQNNDTAVLEAIADDLMNEDVKAAHDLALILLDKLSGFMEFGIESYKEDQEPGYEDFMVEWATDKAKFDAAAALIKDTIL